MQQENHLGRRYFIWLCAGFLAGIFLALFTTLFSSVSLLLFVLYSILFLLLALGIAIALYPLRKFPLFRERFFILLICVFFLLGIFRVYLFDAAMHTSVASVLGSEHRFSGVVLEEPTLSSTGKTYGFRLWIRESDLGPLDQKVMAYVKKEECPTLIRGDEVSFTATLSQQPSGSFSGDFDERMYYYRQNLYGSVFCEGFQTESTDMKMPLSYHLETFSMAARDSAFSAIDRSFGAHTEEAALLKGIFLGNRDSFTDAQAEHFSNSGLLHITATSGMHISFWVGFLAFLFRQLRLPARLIRLITIPFLFLFALIAAMTPSIMRAVLMTSLSMLALELQKEPDPLSALSFSAMTLALFNPYVVTGYSFLLSFGATLGILVFYPPLRGWLLRPKKKNTFTPPTRTRQFLGRTGRFCGDSLLVSASANLGLGYFMARFFNRFSYGGLIGNILIIPLGSFTFLGALLLCGLSPISTVAASFFAQKLLVPPLWLMNQIAAFFSHRWFSLYLPTPPVSFLFAYLFFCVVLYEWLSYKNRKVRL